MFFLFFKQKTAYDVRISDGSSDVCSSDLLAVLGPAHRGHELDAFDARQRILERLGDLGFHDLGAGAEIGDRKSVVEGKSVSVRVDLGGRRIIKTKTYCV